MRKYFKYFSSLILVPFTQWYLRKERVFTYKSITVTVRPGVFHPGLFHSTKLLLSYLSEKKLSGKTFLELGCGTGFLSLYAARQEAIVTASDISELAIENCTVNAQRNHATFSIIQSDLFDSLGRQNFDVIVINPPYYAKDPVTEADYAWNCGAEFQYFQKLFQQLPSFTEQDSEVIMVLTKGCDLKAIFAIAEKNKFAFSLIQEKSVLFDEKDFLFQVRKTD